MNALQFEARYASQWQELETLLDAAQGSARAPLDAARLSDLYRRVCEHLALAQARAYPLQITLRLEALAERAHQLIYRHRDYGLERFVNLVLVDIPQTVRAQRVFVAMAAGLFVLPMLAMAWACYRDPGFLLHLMDDVQVKEYGSMYNDAPGALGRVRGAGADWTMFGFYVRHNITVSFQCFAGGLFAGVGSAFYLMFNGAEAGGLAGYLTQAGMASNFYSFVVTHSAFELTAIVLSGAAGLILGHALLFPGRHTRVQALRRAGRECIVIMYGVIGMLLIAALLEAFWSSARWIPPQIKYVAATLCWTLVAYYLAFQGRAAATAVLPGEASHAG